MSEINGKSGRDIPWIADDVESVSIASADFDPANNNSLTAAQKDKYLQSGFLVATESATTLTVVTWRQYMRQGKTTVGLTGVPIYTQAGAFYPCRLAKIEDLAGTTVTIGLI